MEKSAARILKSTDVKMDGTFRLENSVQVPQQQKAKPSSAVAASSAVQARIVESQPQFAVIEVVCSCGTKTLIRCEYKTQAGQ